MESLEREIMTILDAFAQQELGNRLSEFAMISLRSFISQKIKEHKMKQDIPSGKEPE